MEAGRGEEQRKNLSRPFRINGVSRDLSRRQEEEEVELSLGLSLNGRFGVDPSRKKLRRSSSISNLPVTGGGNGGARGAAFEGHAPLVRASSLPAETEEWRRRKEARRRRMEKLKNVRVVVKDKENCCEDDNNNDNDNDNDDDINNGNNNDDVNGSENVDNEIVDVFESGIIMPSSSRRSQRNGSSGYFDLQEGARQTVQARRLPGPVVQKPDIRAGGRDATNGENELLKNALLDMPFVSTKGYGPDHRKIEGFLYRYKMGEAVKIVCVCHGLFLTPAEFVKHGGGGDVENPLKHIVVTPFPIA